MTSCDRRLTEGSDRRGAAHARESGREPEEDGCLLATRPKEGPFAADGLASWTAALTHPTLGPLLELLPDRLYWSRGTPDEIDAEGIELCLLAHAFATAGHPIRSIPPIRQFAKHSQLSGEKSAETTRFSRLGGALRAYTATILARSRQPTLRALDVLVVNLIPTAKQILKAKRKYVPPRD